MIYINPRKRRGKGRRRHRRNPGGVNVKHTFKLLIAGFAAGGLAAFIDKMLSGKSQIAANLAKVGAAVIVAVVGKRYPSASAAAVGALSGSVGYAMVTRMGGGIVAHSPAGAVKGLAEMSDDYPEMGALLQGGLGALLEGDDDFGDLPGTVDNYETALQNMADGDDDND